MSFLKTKNFNNTLEFYGLADWFNANEQEIFDVAHEVMSVPEHVSYDGLELEQSDSKVSFIDEDSFMLTLVFCADYCVPDYLLDNLPGGVDVTVRGKLSDPDFIDFDI